MQEEQLPILGGQPVVHHHFHPLAVLPELGDEGGEEVAWGGLEEQPVAAWGPGASAAAGPPQPFFVPTKPSAVEEGAPRVN